MKTIFCHIIHNITIYRHEGLANPHIGLHFFLLLELRRPRLHLTAAVTGLGGHPERRPSSAELQIPPEGAEEDTQQQDAVHQLHHNEEEDVLEYKYVNTPNVYVYMQCLN